MPSDLLPPWALPPAALLILGAPILALLRGRVRQVFQVLVPALTVWQVFALQHAAPVGIEYEWMGYTLHLLHVDELRFMFGLIFAIMSFIGSVYALHVEDPVQHTASWIYAGGALGVTFSGDLLAFVLFWELMGVSSAMLVFRRGTARARKAGTRYVAFHALGGTILLAGVLVWVAGGNSLEVTRIPLGSGVAGWLMLVGVAINAAIPPLGAWLPDAYGEGTVTGSVFLSAFTTKTAVFALIALFAGWKVLLWVGVIMSLYGVVFAVLENNIRRLLAYHIISQVGYMVAGAGMGTAMGLDGATVHAFSHILYKSLLFMGAGAVVYATGKEKLTELGGIARAMPLTLGLYAVGAASISGFPAFNGFISKSMTISAAGQGGWPWAEIGLTVASIGTFLHTGLKLLWFTFITPKDRKHEVIRPLPKNMYAAMIVGAFLCTFFGIFPETIYRWMPYPTDFVPYTWNHLATSVELLVMTAVAFWVLFPKLAGQATVSLDTDWFYRKPLPPLVMALSRGLMAGQEAFGRGIGRLAEGAITFMANPLRVAERAFGRGILEPGRKAALERGEIPREYSEDRYRFPVGITVLAVLTVFGVVAILHLFQLAGL